MTNQKSNYVINYIGFDERSKPNNSEHSFENLPQIYEVTELEKTDFQKSAIDKVVRLYNQLTTDLGLEVKIDPSHDRIHITTEKEYEQKIGNNSGGLYYYGHIYLYTKPNWHFIHSLTHELAHMLSYLEIEVLSSSNDLDIVQIKKDGLLKICNSSDYTEFVGINEAITEKLACQIRHDFVKDDLWLNEKDKNNLLSNVAYCNHMKIIDKVAKLKNISNLQNIKNFLYSYLFGGHNFIKTLPFTMERIDQLKKIGTSEEEALIFLESL